MTMKILTLKIKRNFYYFEDKRNYSSFLDFHQKTRIFSFNDYYYFEDK
jgi:hypothetical protein